MPLAADASNEMERLDPPGGRGAEHERLKNVLATIGGTFGKCRPPSLEPALSRQGKRSAVASPAGGGPSAGSPVPLRRPSNLPSAWEGTLATRVKAESGDVQLREAPSPFAAEVARVRPGTPLLARELRGDWVAVTTGDG